MREKVELKAVYESDLQNVLTQLGILDSIIAGEIKCGVCGETIDLDNTVGGDIFTVNGRNLLLPWAIAGGALLIGLSLYAVYCKTRSSSHTI